MLALDTSWIAAFAKRKAQPYIQIDLYYNPADNSVYKRFSSWARTGIDKTITAQQESSIISITNSSRELDPIERSVHVNQITVDVLMDSDVQSLITDYGLIGAYAYFKIGEKSLGPGIVEPFFFGLLDGVKPKEKSVELLFKEYDFVAWKTKCYSDTWFGKHPIEILKSLLEQTLLIDGVDINTTSFTWDNDATISHYVVSGSIATRSTWRNDYKTSDDRVTEAALDDADPIIQDLLNIVNGNVLIKENGVIYFQKFDSSAAVVANWTDDDLDEFEILSLYDNLINKIIFKTHPKADGFILANSYTDTSSASTKFPLRNRTTGALSANTKEKLFESNWVRAFGYLRLIDGSALGAGNYWTAIWPAVGNEFTITAHGWGFCGTKWSGFPSGTQDADALLSDARTAYLKVNNEIIEVDRCTIDTNQYNLLDYYAKIADTTITTTKAPVFLTFRVKTRGALGTTAAAATRTADPLSYLNPYEVTLFDITIPLARIYAIAQRCSNGMPVISCTTNLSQYAMQLGDLVTITTNRYKAYGRTSVGTETKWEIIKKEIDWENCCMKWSLAWATETSPPAMTDLWNQFRSTRFGQLSSDEQIQNNYGNENVFTPTVGAGLSCSVTSGLNYTITAGYIDVGQVTQQFPTTYSGTVTASRDTYVFWNTSIGGLYFDVQNNGSSQPTYPTIFKPLFKIVSGGAAISAITNLYGTTNIKSLDIVNDGSTYKRVVSVDSSHQITADSVKNGVLNYRKMDYATQFGGSINVNCDFNIWDD